MHFLWTRKERFAAYAMGRRVSEELWHYENRYDNDNERTIDSDNDSSVDSYNSDGFPIDSSVTNNN